MQRKQSFPDTDFWSVQNVHKSVSCTVVSITRVRRGSSCTIVSPFVHHMSLVERKEKYPKYDILSVLFVHVCRTCPTKIRISESQLYPKYPKEWRFRDTSMQFVQNVHRFASCAIGQVKLHSSAWRPCSTKTKNTVKSTISVLFASLCTKDLEPRWAAKWSNCEQSHTLSSSNEVSWPTSRMCSAVPRAL